MSNFKKGKHTEKMVEWHSPKEYQEHIDVVSEQLEDVLDQITDLKPENLKKKPPKSKFCRKLKGPHQFGEWVEHIFSWSKKEHSGFWERFCVKCNRKDTWVAPTLPGPYWQLDLAARPPGYGTK